MEEYRIRYRLKGYGYVTVVAENEDDATTEVDNVLCGDSPNHEENDWLDQDVLWDIEYETEIVSVNKI